MALKCFYCNKEMARAAFRLIGQSELQSGADQYNIFEVFADDEPLILGFDIDNDFMFLARKSGEQSQGLIVEKKHFETLDDFIAEIKRWRRVCETC